MLVVRSIEDIKKPLTEEQREELRRAAKMPIVFDEDCPELTEEELKKFKRVTPERQKMFGL